MRFAWLFFGISGAFGLVGMALAADAGPAKSLPRVILTRVFETGGSESLSLRCTPKLACEILRYRNGSQVANVDLPARQANAILQSFFKRWPKGAAPGPVVSSKETPEPSYVWDVAYEGQTTRGFVERGKEQTDAKVMRALLSLDGALAVQLYRP